MTARTKIVVTVVPAVIFLLVFSLELACILRINDGHFVYSLDDAYIHLALAENISRGEYGVNLGESSAPSSSIVWPFLLYPFSKSAIGYFIPLMLNFLAAIGTIIVFVRIIFLIFEGLQSQKITHFYLLIAILSIPATNLTGIVFTGMENTLQVFLSSLFLLGIFSLIRNKKVPWGFYAVLILGPLVRYENLALSVLVLIFPSRRTFKAAVISVVLVLTLIIGFSLFLNSKGLGSLPSSILVKSPPLLSQGNPLVICNHVLRNLIHYRQGPLLLLALIWLLYVDFKLIKHRGDHILARIVSVAALLHIIFGQFDPNNRYEIYIWSTMLLTLLYLSRISIIRFVEKKPLYQTILIFCLFVWLTCTPYIMSIIYIPLATNNIYCQHYQMRRFITEFYPVNVAVNDIGLVSYRNDNYVLDLWGLASRKAFFHRLSMDNPVWIDKLAKEHNVKFAMIYDKWFPVVPGDWRPVAELILTRKKISPAFSKVTFYAVGDESNREVKPLLANFKKTLPSGIKFTIME